MAEEEMIDVEGVLARPYLKHKAKSLESPVGGGDERKRGKNEKEWMEGKKQKPHPEESTREEGTDAGGRSSKVTGSSSSSKVSPSFTLDQVEDLIQHAEVCAMQDLREREAKQSSSSQAWTQEVRARVVGLFANSPEGVSFHQVAKILHELLVFLNDGSTCRPLSTAGKRSMFPLPVPEVMASQGGRRDMLVALVHGLNSLHGCGAATSTNSVSRQALKRLESAVQGCEFLDEKVIPTDFSAFLSHRGMDYQGDEVKVAKKITWKGVAGSLPSEVGTLDILEFCEGGVRHFIENMEDYLVPSEMQVLGKTPRAMVDDDEWPEVARGLIECGLCKVMAEKDLFHVGGMPLKNGLFAVSKEEFSGETELLGLIMNLKPLNSLTRALEGDTSTLPAITSLGTMYLDEDEILCTSSENIRCFFYLFRLPRFWYRYLSFGRPVPGELCPPGVLPGAGFLVARVLPMGYANSVGIAQHIHRRVVRRCLASIYPPVGGEQESRRDRVATVSSSVFRVYLDNFDFLQRLGREELHLQLSGIASRC